MSDRPSEQKNRCLCKLDIIVMELHPDCPIHRFSPQARELISLRAHYAATEAALPPAKSIEESHSSRVLELRERAERAERAFDTDEPLQETCQQCHRPVGCVWGAQDELWQQVTGFDGGNGVLCPRCFAEKAESKGIFIAFTAVLHDKDWHPHR